MSKKKYMPAHYISNVVGVIITTNHKTDGIFLPEDDRRHFVAWSELTKEKLRRRLLARTLELVLQRRLCGGRRPFGYAGPIQLRPESTAAEDGRFF